MEVARPCGVAGCTAAADARTLDQSSHSTSDQASYYCILEGTGEGPSS